MATPTLEQINGVWYATHDGYSMQLLDQDRDFITWTPGQTKAYLIDMRVALKAIDPDHPDIQKLREWYPN
jgi:hypothetical protein